MIGIVFSILIALFLVFNPLTLREENTSMFGLIIIAVGTLFFLAQIFITIYVWSPLQRIEQNLAPRIVQTFTRDITLRYANQYLILFLLISYLTAVDAMFLGHLEFKALLIGWTILLGISVNVLNRAFKRVMGYLNPFETVETYYRSAAQSIRAGREEEICDWIDTLAETATKALNRNSSSLSLLALDKLRMIAKDYLEAAKSLTYHQSLNGSTSQDKVSYILFYLFQRYENIFDKAVRDKQEPICNDIVSALGKIALYASKYDITLATYPLHYLTKLSKLAQSHEMQEVANRAILTLLEVGKLIIKEVDIRYVEIKDPFVAIVTGMHDLSKETFRKDKTMSIKLLTQPFQDLKEVMMQDKVVNHQDQPAIVQSIDRVLDEFATLETVLSTMPPIPELLKGKEPQPE